MTLFYCNEIGDNQELCQMLIKALKTMPECAFQYHQLLPECDIDYFTFLPNKKSFEIRYDLAYGQSIESMEKWSVDDIQNLKLVFQKAVGKIFDWVLAESHVFGQVDEQSIENAEQVLQITFPNQYKYLLKNFGAIINDACEIYGLPIAQENECPLWQNVIEVNQGLRKRQQIGTENHHFIAISDDGMDTYYFLDTQNVHNAPIWAINHHERKCVAKNLLEWIMQMKCGFQAA